jgi:hypothetical protein
MLTSSFHLNIDIRGSALTFFLRYVNVMHVSSLVRRPSTPLLLCTRPSSFDPSASVLPPRKMSNIENQAGQNLNRTFGDEAAMTPSERFMEPREEDRPDFP